MTDYLIVNVEQDASNSDVHRRIPMRLTPFITSVATALALVLAAPAGAAANSIDVCCAWGTGLSDGDLTYSISGASASTYATVGSAVEDWQSTLAGAGHALTLSEASGKTVDIQIKVKKGGGQVQGSARRSFDASGFVSRVSVVISGSAFGLANDPATVIQITRHEFGHALGLGHADFNGDLMSTTLSAGSASIGSCDIDGVVAANGWKLVDNSSAPHQPHVATVACA